MPLPEHGVFNLSLYDAGPKSDTCPYRTPGVDVHVCIRAGVCVCVCVCVYHPSASIFDRLPHDYSKFMHLTLSRYCHLCQSVVASRIDREDIVTTRTIGRLLIRDVG